MVNGVCSKRFPKAFCEETTINENSHPKYWRRKGQLVIRRRGQNELIIENSWVVPYNPYLSAKYQCHVNVDLSLSLYGDNRKQGLGETS